MSLSLKMHGRYSMTELVVFYDILTRKLASGLSIVVAYNIVKNYSLKKSSSLLQQISIGGLI